MSAVSFDQPLWLLALPLAAIVVWLGLRRRSGRAAPARRQRAATALRAVTVVLLLLALAGPRLSVGGRDVDVAFLVDASDSVGAGGREQALAWVRAALDARSGQDRAALALFARDARLEYRLTGAPPQQPPAVVVDGSATDFARALRLGQGVLGGERRRRAVLLTDGRQNAGDLVVAAEELAEAGIALDVVLLDESGVADVLVEEVLAPSRVREGESYEVVVVVANTGAAPAQVVVDVTADGQEIERRVITAEPGATEVRVARVAAAPGTVRYEARVFSGASTVTANDVGRAGVRVDGPPRVLVFERAAGLGEELAEALRSAGVPADRRDAAQPLPPLDRLLEYDSVVLVDVPAAVLGETGMRTLDAFVRDAGHGLVAVGGDESFGLGEYDATPLEELLPVFARVTDPQRRPSVAQALVVDTSGSMGACHCRDEGNAGGGMIEGGIVKTDIAKEAVARAVETLEAQDTVGVLAFNTASRWVIPLQQLPSQDVIDGGLARIHPDGDTDIAQALREAIAGLRDTNAKIRHVVLFTDGFVGSYHGLEQAARKARDEGITVSVVGTGEGSFEELRRVAAIGGGRYYPGRDLNSIPQVIALEVMFTARPIINEGRFHPVVTGLAPAVEDLESTPPLLGYLATSAKPTARTVLAVGEERDPLLATWQAGLGTTTAWTSDVAARWSAAWLDWARFSRFWADVVKETFPVRPDPGFALSARATPDGLMIGMELTAQAPLDAVAEVTVTDPGGGRRQVALDRTSLTSFAATVPAGEEGVWSVAGGLRRGEEQLHHDAATAIVSYSPEYAVAARDEHTLDRAMELTGGRRDPDPATAFDRTGLAPGSTSRELWPALALLALALAPLDVGVRRLRLERADWGRLVAWLRGRRPGRDRTATAARDEATDALFAAKARARSRHGPAGDAPDEG